MFRTVAAASESDRVKEQADYVCDGVDDHVQINAALADVGVEKITPGANGGSVCLFGRRFNTGNPLLAYSQTHLFSSYGWGGTCIFPQHKANGWGGTATTPVGMIQLATENTQYVKVSGITLMGNGEPGLSGVWFYVGVAQQWDAQLNLTDMRIFDMGRSGVEWMIGASGRNRAGVMRNLKIINPGVSGWVMVCPDYTVSDSEVGSAGSHGVDCRHSNGKWVDVKSWYSQGNGFHVTGGRDNVFSACDAQDNKGDGFYLSSAKSVLSSCQADSNGKSGDPTKVTGVGFRVIGSGTNVQGTASDKWEGGRNKASGPDASKYGWQEFGVQIVGTPKVIVNVTTNQNRSGPLSGTAAAGSSVNVVDY